MNNKSEILIIGGGVMGLAIAIELKLKGASVTVLSRNAKEAAMYAAAGMLAPRAEQLKPGPMLDLALKSLYLYPEWTSKLEKLSGEPTGYLPCGILAPVYQHTSSPLNPTDKNALWLDSQTIQLYQPDLGKDVKGGWWYAEDAQVDTRQLGKTLLKVAESLSIEIKEGIEVTGISQQHGKVKNVLTKSGIFEAETYILASGAWSHRLLPIPVRPIKGQMLSLRMPHQDNSPYPIERVIYGESTYLVPKPDGRLIVGATVEDIGWIPHTTARGINTLLQRAIRLYPPLEDWPLDEVWYGYRPGTPDELPILGQTNCDQLIVATGHYRNGILLAPVTASLISDLVLEQKRDSLLSHFALNRFSAHNQVLDSNQKLNYPILKDTHKNIGNGNNHSSGNKINLITPNSHLMINSNSMIDDPLIIAGRKFKSRLMTGTGKYSSLELMQRSVQESECEIVTVAVRRVQTKAPGHEGLAEALDWSKIWMLPNTAGCKNAEEAVRVARLGREMAKLLGQEDNNFVKLEVIPDSKYLLPDPIGTLQAAEQLVKEGFAVLPYINADPLLAKRLEDAGCATVMPLGSPIGSGQGIKNEANIKIIMEQAKIPVVIDAGIGTPSEALFGMELGADALLINSAIALAKNPPQMAKAMGLATLAGRIAFLAGRIPVKDYANASSPLTGVVC
jgi:thiazole synthase